MSQEQRIEYFMQSTYPETVVADLPETGIRVRVEWVVYALLLVALIVMRFANLDTAPMSDMEATQAMTAWDAVYPRAASMEAVSAMPLTFYGQVLGLSTAGKAELAARAAVAVTGVVLALLALLFRPRLGSVQTFLLALIWGLSPVALNAARTSDSAIWAAMFAVLMLWAVCNYWDTAGRTDGMAVLVFACCLAFLSGPYGLLLLVLLLIALAITAYLTALNAPLDYDLPSEQVIGEARAAVRSLPWAHGLGIGFVLTLLIATALLLNVDGLAMIGESMSVTLRGFVQLAPGASIPIWPLLIVVVYELGAVVLGIGGYIVLQRHDRVTVGDRFALVLVLVTMVAAVLYRGAGPGFALFITLPLGWLVARVVSTALVDEAALTFWDLVEDRSIAVAVRYGWVKWMLALILIAILTMVGTHLQEVGRVLLTFAPGQTFFDNVPRLFAFPSDGMRSLVWVVMSLLFTVVGSLLVASIWGNRITLQGIAIGLFGFTLVSGLGGGWNSVVVRASSPREIWQSSYVLPDAYLLRDTLYRIAQLNTRGEPTLTISVVESPEIGLVNHGLTAWLLRDFQATHYVSTNEEAARNQIVITRRTEEATELGGSYVGQSFGLRTRPYLADVPVYDWVSWLAQRRTRPVPDQEDQVILWLRLDLYNSAPLVDGINP